MQGLTGSTEGQWLRSTSSQRKTLPCLEGHCLCHSHHLALRVQLIPMAIWWQVLRDSKWFATIDT